MRHKTLERRKMKKRALVGMKVALKWLFRKEERVRLKNQNKWKCILFQEMIVGRYQNREVSPSLN